jgi:hypothetical protein
MSTPVTPIDPSQVAATTAVNALKESLRPKSAYGGAVASAAVMLGMATDMTQSVSGAWQAPLPKALLNTDMFLRTPGNSGPFQFNTLKEAQDACSKQLKMPAAKRTAPPADGVVGWQVADPAVGGSGVCAGVAKLDQGGYGLFFDPVRIGAAGGQDPDRYGVYPKTCTLGACTYPMAYHGFQPLKGGQSACSMIAPDPFEALAGATMTSAVPKLQEISNRRDNPQFIAGQGAVTKDGKEAVNFAAAKKKCLLDNSCAGVCRQPNPSFATADYSDYGTYAKPAAPFTIGTGSATVYLYSDEAATAWPDMLGRQWDAQPTIGSQPGKNAGLGQPSVGLPGVQVRCAGDATCAGIVQYADGTYQAVKSIVPGALGNKSWAISAALAPIPPPPFVPVAVGADKSVADARPIKWAAALPSPPATATAATYAAYVKALCEALIPWKVRFLLWYNSQQKDDSTRIALFGNGLDACSRDTVSRFPGVGVYVQVMQWAAKGSPLPLPNPLPINKAPGRLIFDMITDQKNVPIGSDTPETWMILPTESICASRPLPTPLAAR